MTSDRLAAVSREMTAEFENGADVEQTAEVTELRRIHDYDIPLSMNTGLSDEALASVGIDRYKHVKMGENGRYEAVAPEVSDDDAEEKMTGFREALRANRGISDESLAELGIERDALVSEIS